MVAVVRSFSHLLGYDKAQTANFGLRLGHYYTKVGSVDAPPLAEHKIIAAAGANSGGRRKAKARNDPVLLLVDRNGKPLAALLAAAGKHLATVLRGHSLKKAVGSLVTKFSWTVSSLLHIIISG